VEQFDVFFSVSPQQIFDQHPHPPKNRIRLYLEIVMYNQGHTVHSPCLDNFQAVQIPPINICTREIKDRWQEIF
jgi:hypothetical protein